MVKEHDDSKDEFDLLDDLDDDLVEVDDVDSILNIDTDQGQEANPDSDSLSLEEFEEISDYGSGVLVYGGQKYAVGLTWLTTDEDSDPKLVYKRAKSMHADFFCSRSYVSQQGFGRIKQGHRMGLPSAAAMAADVLVGEWHAVFPAENGWHYVAVHADNIAPDGDRFFESEEEAFNFFKQKSENYQWPKTYAPDAWNIKNNDGEISLDRVFDDVPSATLKPANLDGAFGGAKNKSMVLLGGLIFIGLVVLAIFARTLLPSLIPDEAKVPAPIIEVADVLSVPPPEAAKKNDPALQSLDNFALPKPEKVVDLCMDGFSDLTVSLPGWNLRTMRCRNTMIEAIWQQEAGSLETIKAYMDRFPFGVNKTYGARGDFLASRVIGNLSQHNQKVELADREQILLVVNDRFGKIGRLDVKDILPLSQQIQRGQNVRGARRLSNRTKKEKDEEKIITIQDLPSLGVVFNTETAPHLIQDYFNIPGLRFNFIEWNVYNRRWVYDLQIYLLPQNMPSRRRLNEG